MTARRRGNLKAALTSFVGRDEEVARIGKLLDEYRLVTLVGPGGAGKTRLASVAGAAVVDTIPDGVWMAELAPVSDPADVPSAVMDALDLRDPTLLDRTSAPTPTARDAVTRLIDALSERAALLVLDNCEHLIDAAARLADELLARCPELRILATSREPLGIVGESLVVVPPLALPKSDADARAALDHPSVRLFADRAAAVEPAFAVDDATVRDVVEIVRRLDGLPLAIELAAARLRSLPVGEVAARLSDRFTLLTGGSRTAMPRHRTLRAVVEWSWDLLDDAERLLAERFAVFAGTARADDVAAVCADDVLPAGRIADLIDSLVEKSLLRKAFSDGELRYRMLETLREFGLERLAERNGVGLTRRRHAEHFAAVARAAVPLARTAAQLEWIHRLEAERENILSALRFLADNGPANEALPLAIDLASYWMLSGRDSDSSYWLGLAEGAPGKCDEKTLLAAQVLRAVSTVGASMHAGRADVEQTLARLRDIGPRLSAIDVTTEPLMALLRPVVAMFTDEPPERIETLVADGLRSTDPWTAGAVRVFHAAIAENRGDIETMRREANVALEQFRALGERWGLASSLGLIGQIKTLDGDLEGAIAVTREALELTSQMSGHDDTWMLGMRLAELLTRVGDLEGARKQIMSVMETAVLTASGMHLLFANAALADLARRTGDLAEARRLRAEALESLRRMPQAHPVAGHLAALALATAARLSVAEGDLDIAREHLSQARENAVGTKDMAIIAHVAVAVAAFRHARGDFAAAATLLGAAARLRGSPDATDPDVAALTLDLRRLLGEAGFAADYDVGRTMPPDAAIGLLSRADA